MITPRMAEFLRVLDEIGKRWEREDAEKASASQADAPAMKTDAPEP